MPTTTVILAGSSELGQIRAFLALGAVVVIAPDEETLRKWIGENMATPPRAVVKESGGLSIQSLARRVMFEGEELPLTDLDYRILTFLAADPDRARSFHEIRQAAWGPSPDLLADAFSVRSAVQRLRKKLARARAPVVIEAVRAYGFRLVRATRPVLRSDSQPGACQRQPQNREEALFHLSDEGTGSTSAGNR